jgi:formylglycine-generating enzyme required for sulfatase activity
MGCLLACTLLAAFPAEAQRRVALVVGNAAYGDAPLANPVNDAQDVAAKLRGLGFDVTLLTNRNRSQMTTAIREFGRSSSGAEAALFYFAGHGVQVRGKNYLLPVGQRFADEAEVETDAVDTGAVLARLEEAGAKVSLLILDACRNNPLQRSSRSAGRGLARMEAPSGALIAFAAQPGAEAKDGTGRNGTFTKHLLKHIDTPGLPVEQVFKRVRADVERETNRAQSPREESSLTAEFSFANSPFAPITPANRDHVEGEAWALCRSGSSRLPCDDYIGGWPQGRFVALARTRIREFEAAAAIRPEPMRPKSDAPLIAAAGTGRLMKDCAECPELVIIPPGSFMMGSPQMEPDRDDDEYQRSVTIPRGFAIGRYEVTNRQWRTLMGSTPLSGYSLVCEHDECPVEFVSWDDAQQFTNRLSQRTGNHYRLPTEAEWEYAARAGTTTRFNTGLELTRSQASFRTDRTSGGAPADDVLTMATRVGRYAPNPWGLNDMHGNLWEWVQDCYGPYSEAPTDGSARETTNCTWRVLRGGGWNDRAANLRAANRYRLPPSTRPDRAQAGFRVARAL